MACHGSEEKAGDLLKMTAIITFKRTKRYFGNSGIRDQMLLLHRLIKN